jgi:hypothetical protein
VRSLTASVATVRAVDIPQLVSDLDGLDSGYRTAQPCITALLARVALINANVIALPSSAAVRSSMPDTGHPFTMFAHQRLQTLPSLLPSAHMVRWMS